MLTVVCDRSRAEVCARIHSMILILSVTATSTLSTVDTITQLLIATVLFLIIYFDYLFRDCVAVRKDLPFPCVCDTN